MMMMSFRFFCSVAKRDGRVLLFPFTDRCYSMVPATNRLSFVSSRVFISFFFSVFFSLYFCTLANDFQILKGLGRSLSQFYTYVCINVYHIN